MWCHTARHTLHSLDACGSASDSFYSAGPTTTIPCRLLPCRRRSLVEAPCPKFTHPVLTLQNEAPALQSISFYRMGALRLLHNTLQGFLPTGMVHST
ncbi:uncharacterized protein LOC142576553 isoform X2 [Dermacentor variabilis]|uniref:uncharacterized protein LOC142576553 isoform X2 n=1 Tax=Dermacentor variabilis TaxID=34621 RepID=UPI003F5B40E3